MHGGQCRPQAGQPLVISDQPRIRDQNRGQHFDVFPSLGTIYVDK